MKNFELECNGIKISGAGYDGEEISKILEAIVGLPAERELTFSTEKLNSLLNENLNESEDNELKEDESESELEKEEIYNLGEVTRTVRMPKSSYDFRCPNSKCHQAILADINANGSVMHIVRDVTGDRAKLYEIEIEKYPDFKTKNGNIKNDIVLSVYKDVLSLVDAENAMCIIDDADEIMVCPICGEEHPMKDWIKEYENPAGGSHTLCEICGKDGGIQVGNEVTPDRIVCKKGCINKVT